MFALELFYESAEPIVPELNRSIMQRGENPAQLRMKTHPFHPVGLGLALHQHLLGGGHGSVGEFVGEGGGLADFIKRGIGRREADWFWGGGRKTGAGTITDLQDRSTSETVCP